jgi:hypothetical protein
VHESTVWFLVDRDDAKRRERKTHTKRLERASKPPGKAFAKTKVANGSKLAVAKTRRV